MSEYVVTGSPPKSTAGGSSSVAITSVIPGTGATNLGKAEDAVSADGDTGVAVLAVRQDTPANTSGADGDYEFLKMSVGRIWASAQVYGDIAHDGIDSGNPIKIGGAASTNKPAAVSVGDRVQAWFDTFGMMHVVIDSGTITANPSASTSGAPTSPSISTTSATVLGSNSNRKMAIIQSPSTAGTVQCFLRFDGSASTTSMLELNRGESISIVNFTGAITGITASGTVILQVVEF